MARPLRIPIPFGVQHVTARGNAKAEIFLCDADRWDFLDRVARTISRRDWRCLAFCLMPNHFHLLVQTPRPNLSAGMQSINGPYAQAFNRRHDRVGHVFQGRFHATVVERDAHLLAAIRYVVRNPVAAGLCGVPEQWPWSSHNAVLAEQRSSGVVDVDQVLDLFGGSVSSYRSFIDAEAPAIDLGDRAVFGTPSFAADLLPERRPSASVPLRFWAAGRPPLEAVLDGHGDNAIAVAHRVHEYSLTEIATHLGCHVSTVSRRLRGVEGRTGPI